MNFFQAVKICIGKYSVFKGRASRSEYFYFLLFVILVQLVLITIDYENYGRNTNFIEYIELVNAFQRMAPFYWVFNVIVLIPTLAVYVRRLHDTNHSGWWFWIQFTIIGFIPLLFWILSKSNPKENKYGQIPIEVLPSIKKKDSKKENELKAYEIAGEEIESGNFQKGLWNKAYVESSGDEIKQKTLYIKYRVKDLLESSK